MNISTSSLITPIKIAPLKWIYNTFTHYNQNLQPVTPNGLVFTMEDGHSIVSVLAHNFNRVTRRAGLKNGRFHDLRHSFALPMLLRRAKPIRISEASGHASVAFTMDTYSHIIEGMQEEAMSLLDGVMPVGISQKSNAILAPKVNIISPNA